MEKKLRIAVIAHDGKKAELISFVIREIENFKEVDLLATGTTGLLLEEAGLKVERKRSGPLGGDAQIAAEVVEGRVHGVIFIMDPLSAHPHDPDIQMLLRICNVMQIPIATNIATAKLMVRGRLRD
jgi:methylglyoxal synthase